MKRLLPIGMQDFADIRQRGFVYIDKTTCIHQLITGSGKFFFLSRPRRFGKSLLCSTLEAIFEAKRELFTGIAGQQSLAIDSLNWAWEKHPVIKIDLNPGNYTKDGIFQLHVTINQNLEYCAKKNDVPFIGDTISDKLYRLICNLHEKTNKQVVVIIDEYDKPLLETLDNKELHAALRMELKGFYGVLKSADKHLRLVFLTGVTKFSQVSIFSDLNNLSDLSFDTRYADICGISQEELEQNFEPEIKAVLKETNRDRCEYMENLRTYYNGYRFSKKPLRVYNPWGLLNHFDKSGEFRPYWYASGTPTFLLMLIKEQKINILNLNRMKVPFDAFCKYNADNMKAEPILYQTGYLTIVDFIENPETFIMDYPNVEVRSAFTKHLLEYYLESGGTETNSLFFTLVTAFIDGNVDDAMNAIRQFLASIPYNIIEDREKYFQTAIHLIFSMFGLNCRSEVCIAAGRIDTIIETKNFVYCFEFKFDKPAKEALAQIDSKDYLLPWSGKDKKLFKIGVSFNAEKRNVDEWLVVTTSN